MKSSMNKKLRHIGVATSARSDFGLLTPLLDALHEDPDISLGVYATGMHFSKRHGNTIDEIRDKPHQLVHTMRRRMTAGIAEH